VERVFGRAGRADGWHSGGQRADRWDYRAGGRLIGLGKKIVVPVDRVLASAAGSLAGKEIGIRRNTIP
jgi:hypothetical protein